MAIITVNVPVVPSGDGPAVNISTLVGKKTVTLSGTFRGAYTLMASHDGVEYAPVLLFNTNGPGEETKLTLAAAYHFVLVRTNAHTTGSVTVNVAGVVGVSENFFGALATVPAGAQGKQPVVDTAALFPPSGLVEEINVICVAGLAGSIIVTGSNDGLSFNPIGTFSAGIPQRPFFGIAAPLQFAPLTTEDQVRYIQIDVQGQLTSPAVLTIGGRIPAANTGSTWYHGSGAPAVGLGDNGSYYLDTAASAIYYKSGGVWTLIDSMVGTLWLNGSGVPAVGLGNNGNYYIDTANNNVYYKTGGVWTLIASLSGATWLNGAGAPGAGLGVNGNYYLDTTSGNSYYKSGGAWSVITVNPDVVYANPPLTDGLLPLAVPGPHSGHDIGDSLIEQSNQSPIMALGLTHRNWRDMCVAPNGNVYCSAYSNVGPGDYIYMQSAGSGDFHPVGIQTESWGGMAASPNGNIYAATNVFTMPDGDLWMQTNGNGDFISLGAPSRPYTALTVAPNGDVYATTSTLGVGNGRIYKQTGGVGAFVDLGGGVPTLSWNAIAAAPNGDIYATGWGLDVYLQVSGSTTFVPLGLTPKNWMNLAIGPDGSVYATVGSEDIYVRKWGQGPFVPMGLTHREWIGLCVSSNNNVYASVQFDDIYEWLSGAIYVGMNMQVGGFMQANNLLLSPGFDPAKWELFTGVEDPMLKVVGNTDLDGGLAVVGKTVHNGSVYVVGNNDFVLEVTETDTAYIDIYLPKLPFTKPGRFLMVVDSAYNASANNINLIPNGADKINNLNVNYVLNTNGASVWLRANVVRGNWEIVAVVP